MPRFEMDNLAALAILRGFITEAQSAEADELCRRLDSEGVNLSLFDAFQKKGFLSPEQVAELTRASQEAKFRTFLRPDQLNDFVEVTNGWTSTKFGNLCENVPANIRIVRTLTSADGQSAFGGMTTPGNLEQIVLNSGQLGGTWAHEFGHAVGIRGDYKDAPHRDRVMWWFVEGRQNILDNDECDAYEK